jgi:hypothetical protein
MPTMTELFEQYSIIHFNLTASEVILQFICPYGEPSTVLISSDFFSFYGEKAEVTEALKLAIAQNQLLPNQEG